MSIHRKTAPCGKTPSPQGPGQPAIPSQEIQAFSFLAPSTHPKVFEKSDPSGLCEGMAVFATMLDAGVDEDTAERKKKKKKKVHGDPHRWPFLDIDGDFTTETWRASDCRHKRHRRVRSSFYENKHRQIASCKPWGRLPTVEAISSVNTRSRVRCICYIKAAHIA